MRRAIAAAMLAAAAAGCGPSVYMRTDHAYPGLAPTCCPDLYQMNDAVPGNALLIGEVRLGDTGFSTRCSQQEAMERVRAQACRIGADLVKITAQNYPNFVSTCYRVRAGLYRKGAAPTSAPVTEAPADSDRAVCSYFNEKQIR
ncbi:MAG TPA: hypothetical protein VGK20_14415 [Candidatus Binatia bacterium]